ncbi:TAXI family TRAP transporter solute-binding subunit [Thermodesulfobacteriota bacterium]
MRKNRFLTFTIIFFLTVFIVNSGFAASSKAKLPSVIGWTTYGVGSAGQAKSMAVAESIRKNAGIEIRVIPSGTDMARILPLRTGEAAISMVGGGATFVSAYGIGYLASQEWGPLPLRCVWYGETQSGVFTTKNTGIKTLADIKGRRVANVPGSISYAVQMAAVLAAAGLTWGDVTPVVFSGFTSAAKGVMAGTAEISMMTPTGSVMYEIEAKKGLAWLPLPSDPESIDRFITIAPHWTPGYMNRGASIDPKARILGTSYAYPCLALKKQDSNLTYAIAKAFWEEYDNYKDKTADLKYWGPKYATDPSRLCVPYHDGTVQLFKDKGAWTPEMEKWQNKAVALEKKRIKAYGEAIKAAKDAGVKPFKDEWMKPVTGFWHRWLMKHDLIQKPAVKLD